MSDGDGDQQYLVIFDCVLWVPSNIVSIFFLLFAAI